MLHLRPNQYLFVAVIDKLRFVHYILHGDKDISEDQLLDLADVMTEAYKLLSAKLEEMGFTEYAKQQLTLGEDVSSVVLEIEPIEGGDNVD